MNKIMMSKGKYDGINAIADKNGIIAALAMDQRGSLLSAIAKARGGPVTEADMQEFKMLVTEILTPYASAILLDPEFGLPAITHKGRDAGVLLAYEKSGYDVTTKGRLPDLIPGWSVKRMHTAGANAIKLLVYYDPEDDSRINGTKQTFVEQVGAECLAEDIPFFLETVCYSEAIGDSKGLEFARVKPGKVVGCMQEFSQKRYAVDVLKVEVPINIRYLEGAKANPDGQIAYSREQAKDFFRQAASVSSLPFIYLSAGVTDEVFRESLELAIEAGVAFAGVLCGRATWQDGIPEYARGGAAALRSWLSNRGIQNIQSLNNLLHSGAMPWWDFYGGKDNIAITY